MKLFAELYLDEDVSVLIATLLRVRGFNVSRLHVMKKCSVKTTRSSWRVL